MTKLTTILFLATSITAFAQTVKPPAPKFDDPRVERANERTIIPVYLCDLQGTEVTLPKGELLRIPTVGDAENWQVNAVKEDRRDISIRPTHPMTKETILNVTSDHDNHYVFRLVMDAGHCDSHVTLEADKDIQSRIETVKPWVSPEQYALLQQQLDDAKKAVLAAGQQTVVAQRKAVEDQDKFRGDFPLKLAFDYVYNAKKAEQLGITAIFHDDRFTYVRTNAQEPPVLFEVRDKKPSLIEFSLNSGLYQTARIIDEGYLARGGNGNGKHQEKMEFKRQPQIPALTAAAHGAN